MVGGGEGSAGEWLAAYLPEARQRYPDLLAVLVEVKPEVLRQRLLARGRESAEEVEQRLARSARLQAAADPSVHVLDNSSTLEAAVAAFVSLLRHQACYRGDSSRRKGLREKAQLRHDKRQHAG